MKTLSLTLFTLLSAAAAAAQDAAVPPGHLGAPGVEVVGSTWRGETPSVKLNEDPLLVAERQADLQDAQKRAIQTNNEMASRAVTKPDPLRIPTQVLTAAGGPTWPPSTTFVYRVKFRNTGTKTIQRLVWQYAPPDEGAEPPSRSRRFESGTKIRPGKTKKLTVRSPSPPLSTISAARPVKAPGAQPTERVVILRVEYEDGTVWVRPTD